FFVDAPFKKPKPDPSTPSEPIEQAPVKELPFDAETIERNRNRRIPYLEAREAVELEQKEMKVVKEKIGEEVREACRPEIDEYIDCCVGRIFTILSCKPQALVMRRCMALVETPEFVAQKTAQYISEREASGESVLNNAAKGTTRERRSQYNRAILPTVEDPNEFLIRKPNRRAPKPCPDPTADIE
ncbi:unnamed protein product, partial [Polarella glacialis]